MNVMIQSALAIYAWLRDLPPLFAFLLSLPFTLAAIGLAADALGHEGGELRPAH